MPPDRMETVGKADSVIAVVQRRAIPDYFTAEFADTLTAWSNTKRWGMPFEGGWADQPCRLMDVLVEYERMYNEWEADEAEKRRR